MRGLPGFVNKHFSHNSVVRWYSPASNAMIAKPNKASLECGSSSNAPDHVAFASRFGSLENHPVVGSDPKDDIKACAAVRKAVGDDWALMIDAVSAYNQTDALRVGRTLEELDFEWYEEPLRDYDIHGYKMLADILDSF